MGGESRSVLRTSAFSYPISNNFPLKYGNYLKTWKEGKTKRTTFVPHVSMTEYTEDNPKIVLQCGHIFHLACIYEWMERINLVPFVPRQCFSWRVK